MSHRINVLSNFVSKEDCSLAIDLLNKYNKENKLIEFSGNHTVFVAPETPEVVELVRKYCMLLNEEHRKHNGFIPKLYTTEAYLSMWQKGSSAGLHFDSHKNYEFLEFASVIYLNEDFVGGKLLFPNQKYIYTPKSGDAVIFPCGGSEYLHSVSEVKEGFRYTIVMWHTSRGRISKVFNTFPSTPLSSK